MPKKVIYKIDTPATEVIKRFRKELVECKKEVLDFHAPTVARGGTAMDMAKNLTNPKWAYWDLKVLGEETSPDIREVLISKLEDYPMMAFQLYLELDWLTDEEDAQLETIFSGLPDMEYQEKCLASRKYKRAKA